MLRPSEEAQGGDEMNSKVSFSFGAEMPVGLSAPSGTTLNFQAIKRIRPGWSWLVVRISQDGYGRPVSEDLSLRIGRSTVNMLHHPLMPGSPFKLPRVRIGPTG